MEDFLELAKARRSCRSFLDKPVEHEKLLKCVEAASLSPSACNSQPWSVVVVEDQNIVPQIAEATMQLGVNGYMKSAKAFFVVLEERARLMPVVARISDSQTHAKGDLGGFALSLTLEATTLGLGTCILGLYDRPRIRELLNISEERSIFLVIGVGYPKDGSMRPKERKPLDQIVRFV
jgi:nitroreductase